jgi:hypothetical protein
MSDAAGYECAYRHSVNRMGQKGGLRILGSRLPSRRLSRPAAEVCQAGANGWV